MYVAVNPSIRYVLHTVDNIAGWRPGPVRRTGLEGDVAEGPLAGAVHEQHMNMTVLSKIGYMLHTMHIPRRLSGCEGRTGLEGDVAESPLAGAVHEQHVNMTIDSLVRNVLYTVHNVATRVTNGLRGSCQ